MKIIKNTTKFQIAEPTAISLGKFDGLHQGHRAHFKKEKRGTCLIDFYF